MYLYLYIAYRTKAPHTGATAAPPSARHAVVTNAIAVADRPDGARARQGAVGAVVPGSALTASRTRPAAGGEGLPSREPF